MEQQKRIEIKCVWVFVSVDLVEFVSLSLSRALYLYPFWVPSFKIILLFSLFKREIKKLNIIFNVYDELLNDKRK